MSLSCRRMTCPCAGGFGMRHLVATTLVTIVLVVGKRSGGRSADDEEEAHEGDSRASRMVLPTTRIELALQQEVGGGASRNDRQRLEGWFPGELEPRSQAVQIDMLFRGRRFSEAW